MAWAFRWKRRKLSMKFALIIALITTTLYAQTEPDLPTGDQETANCIITIKNERFSTVKQEQIIYAKVADKKSCEERAKTHRHNLLPKEIKHRSVEAEFKKDKK